MSIDAARNAAQPANPEPIRFVVAEASDDASSLRSKLEEFPNQRIALIVPDANESLDDLIALRVIARAAERNSIELALVTRCRRLHALAAIEGLPTFRSVGDVPRQPVEDDSAPSPVQSLRAEIDARIASATPWTVALAFTGFSLLVFALAIPREVVTVRPVTDELTGSIKITASDNVSAPDPARGMLPGRTVFFAIDSDGTAKITPNDRLLDGHAVGYVTLQNQTKQPVTVPAGTDVSTFSGIHFQTQKAVTLAGHSGASATVMVKAVNSGPYSNVDRGTIAVVNGPLRWVVSVANDDKMAGGGVPGTTYVTALDTKRAVDAALASAARSARERLAQTVSGQEWMVPETVQVVPIRETFDHPIGETADEVSVKVEARAQAMIVDRTAFDSLALTMWNPSLRSGFVLRPNSAQVLPPKVTSATAHTTVFEVPLRAVSYADVNEDRIIAYTRLRSPRAAEADLVRQFSLAAPPKVTITPKWFPLAYRVQVDIDTSSPLPGRSRLAHDNPRA